MPGPPATTYAIIKWQQKCVPPQGITSIRTGPEKVTTRLSALPDRVRAMPEPVRAKAGVGVTTIRDGHADEFKPSLTPSYRPR